MLKKIIFVLIALGSINAFATDTASGVVAEKQKVLNSPTAGSKQYSTGNFGQPTVKGKKGEKYYTKEQLANPQNDPQNGSVTYSSKTFPQQKVIGKKGETYNTKGELSQGPNQPTQGSKIGSNQVFDYPGENAKPVASSTK